jgi:TRAP-type C4-dicarboxylate transport system permease small subunit
MLGRWFDRVLNGLSWGAGIILVVMGGSILIEIVMRYLFNRPTRWVVEFSEYMLLYMAFLAGAWVLRSEGHVKVDMLVEVLPPRAQAVLYRATSWVGALVCGLFFGFSATFTWETFETGEVLFRAVHVPKWAVLAVIPVGLLLLTLQFIRRACAPPVVLGTRAAEGPGEAPGL